MRYYVEEPLYNFQFWGGAKENANLLTLQELEQIDFELSVLHAGAVFRGERIKQTKYIKK